MADPSENGDIDPMASTERPDKLGPFACAVGEIYAGEYRIDSLIGRGGMGEVYAVTHRTLHAPFALKVLRKGYRKRADIVARFRAESRALYELSHPGFVRVHHAGEDADIGPYMVMELLRGRSLFSLMHQVGPFAESQAIALAIDIAEAAAVMHGLGIVHRDLKPENVFLVDGSGDSPKVKLLDLGAAKIEKYGNPATTDNKTVGTGRYMAPEHIRCLPVSPETDVYSLGHILYEMVTGTHPFESPKPDPSHFEFQVWHLGSKPVPLRVKRPQASPELEALVAQAMDKDIANRFRSMAALSSALSALQASALRRAGGTVALEVDGAVRQRLSRPTETADVRTSRDPIPRSLIVGASVPDGLSDTEIGPALPLASRSSEVAREVRPLAEDGLKTKPNPVIPNLAAEAAEDASATTLTGALREDANPPRVMTPPVLGPRPIARALPRHEPSPPTVRDRGSVGRAGRKSLWGGWVMAMIAVVVVVGSTYWVARALELFGPSSSPW